MSRSRRFNELTAVALIFTLLCLFLPTSPVAAGWLPTRAAVEGPKARLVSMIEREEIALALQDLGIEPAEAKRRVAGLSDAEARQAVERLDNLPAGGNALGVVIGAILVVFFVLLITDILGFTDVFPFVKKTVT